MNEETVQAINELLKKRRLIGSSVIWVALGCFAGMFLFAALKLNYLSAVFFAVIVIYSIFYAKVINAKAVQQREDVNAEISRLYFSEFVEGELRRHFDDVVCDPDRGIDQFEFDNAGLFRLHDMYFTSDYFEGSWAGIRFHSGFSKIIRRHKAKGSSDNLDVTYLGRTYVIDLPFSVTQPVKIINDSIGGTHGANAYRYCVARFGKEQRVFDDEFSKNFHCYCDSDMDAARVLTPMMTESIAQVREDLFYIPTRNGMNYRRFKMALCFHGDKLYLQFENSLDGFRIGKGTLDPDTKLAQIDKQLESVKLIFDAVDSYTV